MRSVKNNKQLIVERKARYGRIIEALQGAAFSIVQERIGASLHPIVSQGGVGGWKAGRTTPSPDHMTQIALMTGCSFEWLWTGRGSRHLDNAPDTKTELITQLLDSLTPKEKSAFWKKMK